MTDPWDTPSGPETVLLDPGPVEHDVPPDEPDEPAPDVPADVHAERAALGAMLTSTDAVLTVLDTLTGADYWDPRHELIHGAIEAVFVGNGEVPDPVNVLGMLLQRGQVREAGGHAYIAKLISPAWCPAPGNAAGYAKSVKEQAVLRRLLAATTRVQQLIRAHAADVSSSEVADITALAVTEITHAADSTGRGMLVDAADALGDLAENLGEPLDGTGVLWPGRDLNSVLLPMRPGQLIVVAARPGVGKTTHLLGVAAHAAIRQNVPTLLVSLEMNTGEIAECLLAAEGGISKKNITDHKLDDAEWNRVWEVQERLGRAPLVICDDPRTDLGQLDRLLRRGYRGQPWGLVCYDYLQLAPRQPGARPENRQVEVAEIARTLKLLAKRHAVPLMAAAQLNRALESRAEKKPTLADLRESGGIEADADTVSLLHREDYHDRNHPRAGEVDFIVAKQRRGPTDVVTLASQLHLARFWDMAV